MCVHPEPIVSFWVTSQHFAFSHPVNQTQSQMTSLRATSVRMQTSVRSKLPAGVKGTSEHNTTLYKSNDTHSDTDLWTRDLQSICSRTFNKVLLLKDTTVHNTESTHC